MSAIKGAMDAYYASRFSTLMGQRWTQWDAYKRGIIDAKGNVIKKAETPREKASYTRFHAMVRSLKQSIQKFGGEAATTAIAAKAGWDTITEAYGKYQFEDSLVENFEKTDLDYLREAMVAGDHGGNADDIASGKNSGPITGKGPEILGKKKKKEEK